jgi:hypothetical protein
LKTKEKYFFLFLCFVISTLVIVNPLYEIFFHKADKKSSTGNIYEDGNMFLEIRLNNIKLEGNETTILSDVDVKINSVEKEPEKVYLEYKDDKHSLGRYRINGNYSIFSRVWEGGRKNIPLYPKTGSIQQFPFDDLNFKFNINFDPNFKVMEVHFYNYLTSYSLNLDAVKKEDGKNIIIGLELERKVYSQILFIVIILLFGIFIAIIIATVKTPELAVTSLVTFFISMFAIRDATLNFIRGYITVVDIFFLFFSVLLVTVIILILISLSLENDQKVLTSEK